MVTPEGEDSSIRVLKLESCWWRALRLISPTCGSHSRPLIAAVPMRRIHSIQSHRLRCLVEGKIGRCDAEQVLVVVVGR